MARSRLYISNVEDFARTHGLSYDDALSRITSTRAYSHIPHGYGECPVCHGTGYNPEPLPKYFANELAKLPCSNCGGQTMSGCAKGYVLLRRDNGQPCEHKFVGREAGRCYRIFTCTVCGDSYDEDSSD